MLAVEGAVQGYNKICTTKVANLPLTSSVN